MPSTISAGTTAGTAIAIAGDTTGNLAFQTNGTTTAMTIDTSQNVGVGTASPASKLHVVGDMRIGFSGVNQYLYFDSASNYVGRNVSTGDIWLNTQGGAETVLGVGNVAGVRVDGSANLKFNSGFGSVATAYGCRAWVNFKGTDTVSIRASGNVSSITDVATGTYWVNFINAMPDINYCVQGNRNWRGVFNSDNWETGRVYMISADTNNNVQADALFCFVSIYR